MALSKLRFWYSLHFLNVVFIKAILFFSWSFCLHVCIELEYPNSCLSRSSVRQTVSLLPMKCKAVIGWDRKLKLTSIINLGAALRSRCAVNQIYQQLDNRLIKSHTDLNAVCHDIPSIQEIITYEATACRHVHVDFVMRSRVLFVATEVPF